MSHPDTVLRMACAAWLRVDDSLSPEPYAWLQERLTDYRPFTAQERARVVPKLMAWLRGYDAPCADVVRLALDEAEEVPWRGYRSHANVVKVLQIVKDLQERQDALPSATPTRPRRRR